LPAVVLELYRLVTGLLFFMMMKGENRMASDKKWRRKKIAKHKHRKKLKKTRWQRRQAK
jgi:Mitochondrial mRNA-processing protein COX24, C-terminal